MMSNAFDVVSAGHICLDIIPKFLVEGKPDMGKLFLPGKLINMGEVKVSTGGPVSNTGLGMHILGTNARFMGKVGDDFFGHGVLQLLEQYNAADSMTVVKGEQTSYTIVVIPGDVDRIFLHHTGTNDTFCSEDVNYDVVGQGRLFHLGYPPLMRGLYSNDGAELINTFKRAKETGVTTALDMSLPDPTSESGKVNWKKVLEGLLPYVDIFLPSGEEALFMLRRETYDKLAQRSKGSEMLDEMDAELLDSVASEILELGSKVAVVKLAHRGMFLRTAGKDRLGEIGKAACGDVDAWSNRQLWEEAFYVEKVASATGSGDSSIAGFLSAYLRGLSPEDCLKVGCCVGGQNVQVMDAVSGIKTWDQTQAMIKTWEKRRQDITAEGWRYDDGARVWIGSKDRA